MLSLQIVVNMKKQFLIWAPEWEPSLTNTNWEMLRCAPLILRASVSVQPMHDDFNSALVLTTTSRQILLAAPRKVTCGY